VFSVSLDLPEFEVVKQVFLDDCNLVHVEKNTTEERCSCCGFPSNNVHDWRTRKVRDLSVLGKPLYLFVKVHRYCCHNCDEVFSQTFESIEPNKQQTKRYREYLYEMCHCSTIQEVSQKEKMPYTTVERIFYSIAKEKELEHLNHLEGDLGNNDIVISLDEIAVRKGHRYETVLMDAQSGCVLGMEHQRSYDSTKSLLTKNILSNKFIHTVVLDMWDPFHKAVNSIFPEACIVIDKYHVVQKVTQALDQVRKKIPGLKKGRFKLLKGAEKLTTKEKQQLDDMLEEHLELSYAYFLKELFRDVYQAPDYDTAETLLEEWIQLAWSSPFAIFHQVAKTIENWKAPILQYFLTPFTNGRIEGTNHKIKNIKRRAFGFRNLERFRLRVFLECTGKTYKKQAA
jgi:transposase